MIFNLPQPFPNNWIIQYNVVVFVWAQKAKENQWKLRNTTSVGVGMAVCAYVTFKVK